MSERYPQSPVVVVHLMGGLGNQMFQYAFGRRLALANKAELVLDATGYGKALKPDPAMGIRSCGLQHFRIEGRIIHAGDQAVNKGLPFRRWLRKTGQAPGWFADAFKPYYQREHIVEPTVQYHRLDPRVRDRRFRGTLWVRGFWQSEAYFIDIAHKIRAELTVIRATQGKNRDLADQMQACESAAIHVRHGDNANSIASNLGTLKRDYYDRAIAHVRRNVERPRFFVFSEDIPWARSFLEDTRAYTFVDNNDAQTSHEDMRLMTFCKHHIIANSTFSWWGAWLGKKNGQIVVAPKRYYLGADRSSGDLYPQGWRLLQV